MVDAVDSLLNNAVDLYVQAVDYHRIPTSQIPTPIIAGFRLDWPESCRSGQKLPEFVCVKYKKKNIFILFYINIFYFVNKI
jgi:hypothetical protein